MNRKKKLLLNTTIGLLKQLVMVVCGFLLPKYILVYFGSSINGLVSSITHFLGFISLLEMGIGPVVQASLYKPLSNKDYDEISKVIVSSERFFRRIAYIFIAYIALLVFIFPKYINEDYDWLFTSSLLLIIAFSTFSEYFFCATYKLLLNADQKSYVQLTLQVITIVLNLVVSILLMSNGYSIHYVKFFAALVYIIRPIVLNVYVSKNYAINKNIILEDEPIKQKWNGFSQHLAAVVCVNIDVVLLTMFSTLANVSVYHIYYLVVSGITSVVMTAATGLEALLGNMIARNENNLLLNVFESVELLIHSAVTFLFTVTAITIVPFVKIYTYGINDANYDVPVFAVLLVFAYSMQCLRVPYFRIIKAAGHFKQTQNGAYISTLLNILFSIIVVIKHGLPGVALGTFIAMFYHTCYFVWYLRTNIINRSVWFFIKYLIIDTFIGFIAYFCCSSFVNPDLNYVSWSYYALKVSIMVGIILCCINILIFKNKVKLCYDLLFHKKK